MEAAGEARLSAGRKGRPGQQEAGEPVPQACRGHGMAFRFSFMCSEKPLEVFEQRSDTSGFFVLQKGTVVVIKRVGVVYKRGTKRQHKVQSQWPRRAVVRIEVEAKEMERTI